MKTDPQVRSHMSPLLWPSKAFTLIELLVVIAILGLLSALVLQGVSRAKHRGRSLSCVNQLHQIGLALTMYLSDNASHYPPNGEGHPFRIWADRLYPYQQVSWTNVSWNCPGYVTRKGVVGFAQNRRAASFSYNFAGIVGLLWVDAPRQLKELNLGLGQLPKREIREPEVQAPSEMYTIADARAVNGNGAIWGELRMTPWLLPATVNGHRTEASPSHEQGFNMLFADSHVSPVKRSNYLFPPRTARNWNRDNQPHAEAWAPRNAWAVQD